MRTGPRSAFPAATEITLLILTTLLSYILIPSLRLSETQSTTISQHDYPQARRQLPQRRCLLVSCNEHKMNPIRVNSYRQSLSVVGTSHTRRSPATSPPAAFPSATMPPKSGPTRRSSSSPCRVSAYAILPPIIGLHV